MKHGIESVPPQAPHQGTWAGAGWIHFGLPALKIGAASYYLRRRQSSHLFGGALGTVRQE